MRFVQPCMAGIAINCFLLAAVCATAQAQSAEVWQGSFQIGPLWGGFELVLGGAELRARFTPNGHLEAPALLEPSRQGRELSFIAPIESVQYRFHGRLRGTQWSGTMIPTVGDTPQHGSWILTKGPTVATASLPASTGAHSIGRADFDWTDRNRLELETRIPDDSRQVIVHLFYPAETVGQSAPATYMPDADVMLGPDWTAERISQLKAVRTHTWQEAPVAKRGRPFPVVIFAPGGGQKALLYTSLFEELASHGYIVAAIQPPYSAGVVRLPNGSVSGSLPFADRGWETPKTRDDMPRIYEQMVVHWARDMSFVLEQLTVLNKSDARFAAAIDIEHVGAFGHSRGGQAAGKVRLLDRRFDAGMNLDGNIRGRPFPPDAAAGSGKQPFLWLEKQLPWPKKDSPDMTIPEFEEMWANGDRILRAIPSESLRLTIAKPGIDHLDFGDTAMLNATLTPEDRSGKLRTLAIARKVILAFFDTHLKGAKGDPWAALAKEYPEVRVTRYPIAELR